MCPLSADGTRSHGGVGPLILMPSPLPAETEESATSVSSLCAAGRGWLGERTGGQHDYIADGPVRISRVRRRVDDRRPHQGRCLDLQGGSSSGHQQDGPPLLRLLLPSQVRLPSTSVAHRA